MSKGKRKQEAGSGEKTTTEKSEIAVSTEVISVQELKQINTLLAASAQQELRDKGLTQLTKLLVREQRWVSVDQENPSQQQKHLRVAWEGLFFMFWHADKSLYQKETSLKISQIMQGIQSNDRKQQWFQACMYILNKHWDKVDNFRIDKFLALLRHMFSQVLTYLKSTNYDEAALTWLQALMDKLFQENLSAQGICLQITDVFIPELGKIDKDGISLEQISALLKPFMTCLAKSDQSALKERICERVFEPILESNVTAADSDESSEEENLALVDGGKLSKRSRKAVKAIIDQKYVFPAFNILIYAENYIFPAASQNVAKSDDAYEAPGIVENNREMIYNLYYKALKLEPEPKHPELTFTQRQLMNRARKFVTLRMKRRAEIRMTKQDKKSRKQRRKLLSEQVIAQLRQRFEQQGFEIDQNGEIQPAENNGPKDNSQSDETAKLLSAAMAENQSKEVIQTGSADTGNSSTNRQQGQKKEQQASTGSSGSDEILNISTTKQKKKKKSKAQKRREAAEKVAAGGAQKRKVVFKTENNITREFHTYSKVATRAEPNSRSASPLKSAIKKPREAKQSEKLKTKQAKFA